MTPYSIALFPQEVGAPGLFVAIGLEWVKLAQVRRVDTAEKARDWLGVFGLIRRVLPASLASILLRGIYMMVTARGGVGWIVVDFFAMLLLLPLGASNGVQLPAIERNLDGESGRPSPAFRQRLRNPLFLESMQVRTAMPWASFS